jgi:hypothetical protein
MVSMNLAVFVGLFGVEVWQKGEGEMGDSKCVKMTCANEQRTLIEI